jgi:hypothetical protein
MDAGLGGERAELGRVKALGDVYSIVQAGIGSREVIRESDGRLVGRLRGSPTTMWFLEPVAIELDDLRSIVRCAIVEGILTDMPAD